MDFQEGVHFRRRGGEVLDWGLQYFLVLPSDYYTGAGGYYFLWELS